MSSGEIVDLYERHAKAFDADRARDLREKPWLDRFLRHVRPGGAILDVGCGMGEPIARYFLESGYRVVGIDSSPALIAMCRERFSASEWHVGDMRRLALGRRFDGLLAWDSFFHLDAGDQRATMALFAEHVLPGAPIMFTSGPARGEAIGTWQGESLYHASLDPGEYRNLLAVHGFSVLSYVFEDPACGGHTIWLARYDPSR